jgi:hypothetical protein
MKMRVLVLTTAFALAGTAAFPNTVTTSGITPIQAELISDLNARVLKVGERVYARVTVDWRGTDCVLDNGAILEGQVVSVVPHSKTVKISELDIAFTRAQCGQPKLGAFELLLAAMAAPPAHNDLGILSDPMPGGGGIGGLKGSQFSPISMQVDTEINQFPISPHMKMGDVVGIRGLKLSVGTGPGSSSVLTLTGHDVSLDRRTLLLLVPAQGTFPRAAANAGVASAAPAAASGAAAPVSGEGASPAEPPPDDIDLCAPPQCSEALPPGNAVELGSAATSISIRALGYAPRPQRVIDNFENDDALAWLGPSELLVAFDPHILVPRRMLGRAGWTVRVIRAILLDTGTHQVKHTVDWDLPDNGQYLWPLGQGGVLVHVGSELRVYGEGLKIEKRVSLDGPLAFVRVTPDGSYVAIGILHERHSPELHAALRESLGREPEEDVSIQVLNRNLETIAKSTARSRLMPPTLLNEGQVRILAQPDMHYRIAMQTWDNRAWTIARVTSSCTPELSSIAPDLLFLVSCSKQTQGREYRVLRPNGKPALKGDSTLNECGHAAEGSANLEDFVVKTVQSTLPVPPGALFRADDFSSEDLGVYRAKDGRRLLAARLSSPTSSRGGFALSPDGSELAVLTRDQIAIYSVPQK